MPLVPLEKIEKSKYDITIHFGADMNYLKSLSSELGVVAVVAYTTYKILYCTDNSNYDQLDRNLVEGHQKVLYGALWPISAIVRKTGNAVGNVIFSKKQKSLVKSHVTSI